MLKLGQRAQGDIQYPYAKRRCRPASMAMSVEIQLSGKRSMVKPNRKWY
jgi:hypothetical protein